MIICTILFFLALNLFSQQTTSSHPLSSQDYLKKSKKQKTAAWILLGGGTLTTFIGLSQINLAGSADGEVNNTPGTILFFTGLSATITSIPLFSASKKNKRRAMNASTHFEIRKSPFLAQTGLAFQSVPTFLVKVSL